MTHTCCTLHANSRVDPTKTVTLRARYEADMVRRFRTLAIAVRDAVDTRDAFRLRVNVPLPPPPKFDFRRNPEKVRRFMDWLKQAQEAAILDIQHGTSVASAASRSWQNVYLKSAYQKGLAQAAGQMRRAGAEVENTFIESAFFRPVHADRSGLAYTRAFTDLVGITEAMDTSISRVLAQGLIEGRAPKVLAQQLVSQIAGIGIVRAQRLARTEVIRAHADATIGAYREAGLAGVKVLSEFATARDNAVCPKCRALEGREFTLEAAEGIIPVHPNCRCAWLPMTESMRGIVLK